MLSVTEVCAVIQLGGEKRKHTQRKVPELHLHQAFCGALQQAGQVGSACPFLREWRGWLILLPHPFYL